MADGEANMQRYNDKVAAHKSTLPPDDGIMGPSYSFVDELPTPGEIGVRSGGDFSAISDAVSGVNYYVDAIGFGQKTMFNSRDMNPLGLRYFMNTGSICSNGAAMFDYIDTTPKGNLLGERVKKALRDMGLPGMRGLAPGIMEDARDALNPMPLLRAAAGGGYPQCKLVTREVGDLNGNIRSPHDGTVWIKGDTQMVNGRPNQSRWIQDTDQKGHPVYLDQAAYEAAPKQFYPDGSPITEGFGNGWEDYIDKRTAAGLLLAGIAVSFAVFAAHRK
jgi:hypothetical protein